LSSLFCGQFPVQITTLPTNGKLVFQWSARSAYWFIWRTMSSCLQSQHEDHNELFGHPEEQSKNGVDRQVCLLPSVGNSLVKGERIVCSKLCLAFRWWVVIYVSISYKYCLFLKEPFGIIENINWTQLWLNITNTRIVQ